MNLVDALKFCPRCSHPLEPKATNLKVCGSCKFHFYLNPAPTTAAIIETGSGILTVKRSIEPKKGYYDIPGGFMEPGESAESSLIRECEEELSVRVKVGKLVGGYSDVYEFQGLTVPVMSLVFGAEIVSGVLRAGDDAESIHFFKREEILGHRLAFTNVSLALEDYLKMPN